MVGGLNPEGHGLSIEGIACTLAGPSVWLSGVAVPDLGGDVLGLALSKSTLRTRNDLPLNYLIILSAFSGVRV